MGESRDDLVSDLPDLSDLDLTALQSVNHDVVSAALERILAELDIPEANITSAFESIIGTIHPINNNE